jgi:uncharacterized membrane protein
MAIYVLALLIGVVAGLRALSAPAALSWAVHFGWLNVDGTWAEILGRGAVPYVLSAFALMEFITDQLPTTPSRKVPAAFAARVISGGLCGAVFGTEAGVLIAGAVLGALGAVLGTTGGYSARTALVRAIGGRDRPVAFAEDALAVALALFCVNAAS